MIKQINYSFTLLIIFTFFSRAIVNAQDSTAIKFFDIIKDDSVVMYFDHLNNFTESNCASYKRFTTIDSAGNFDKTFVDIDKKNITIGTGYYTNGVKNGYYETYYRNGILKSKGSFKNNKPAGYWYTYHPNGEPERELLFNVADTFFIAYYNEKGEQLIKNGNGHFSGFVGSSIDKYYNTVIIAEGNIVNGKPDGEWKTRLAGTAYCTEKFAGGFFLSGKLPKHLVKDKEEYNDYSYLNILYQPSYIYRLEEFSIKKCDDYASVRDEISVNKKEAKKNNYNLDNFRSFVNDAVNHVIEKDLRNENYNDYQLGDNLLRIAFTVDEKGVPNNFQRVTSWGDQFFVPITTVMSMHARMPTSSSKIYLVLAITKDASNFLTYRYFFSQE